MRGHKASADVPGIPIFGRRSLSQVKVDLVKTTPRSIRVIILYCSLQNLISIPWLIGLVLGWEIELLTHPGKGI